MNQKTQTLKGFRDFLPKDAQKRAWLKKKMIEIVESWGYEPLETPTLEPLSLFEGQIGEDEKLFYKFKDQGDRDVALRYDQTVPVCRVLENYKNEITFPWRRYQVQSAFRAEKPQAGRYREFLQFDFDLFGVKGWEGDAEVIALTLDIYLKLGFSNVLVLINDRELLKDFPYPAIAAIDKLEKIGEEKVIDEMISKEVDKKDAESYLQDVKNLKPSQTINNLFSYLKNAGFKENNFKFQPTLARSFSYSQGPIWEVKVPGYDIGSLGGGERYDGLVKKITGSDIGGTGIGIGFDRTLDAIEKFNLLPQIQTTSDVLVTIFSEDLFDASLRLATKLRSDGLKVETYPGSNTKLEKQLKYADKKRIPWVVIFGPEEAKNNTVVLKNMATQTQTPMFLEGVAKNIQNRML